MTSGSDSSEVAVELPEGYVEIDIPSVEVET